MLLDQALEVLRGSTNTSDFFIDCYSHWMDNLKLEEREKIVNKVRQITDNKSKQISIKFTISNSKINVRPNNSCFCCNPWINSQQLWQCTKCKNCIHYSCYLKQRLLQCPFCRHSAEPTKQVMLVSLK